MVEVSILDGVPETVPLSAKVLASYRRPIDGAGNDLVRLVRSGAATPLHWTRFLHFLDLTLDSQVVGYGVGVTRFPVAPVAWPFLDFATFKLNARGVLRAASDRIEDLHPAAADVGVPPAAAYRYGWYFLWLGSVTPMSVAGLGMYVALLDWHRFCVEMLAAIDGHQPGQPEEFRRVFSRFGQRPEALDRCLVLAERGLEGGEDPEPAVRAMDLAGEVITDFLRECAK